LEDKRDGDEGFPEILGLSEPIRTLDWFDLVAVAPVLSVPKEAGSETAEATRFWPDCE